LDIKLERIKNILIAWLLRKRGKSNK
jgi:hypothetical protein